MLVFLVVYSTLFVCLKIKKEKKMITNNKKEKIRIAVSLPRNSFDSELAEKLISATKFISKELMSFKKLSTLKIKINVRKTTLGTNTLGRVTHDSKFFAQKEFVIELKDSQCTSEKIETLAHEFVHVKQNVHKDCSQILIETLLL